MSETAQLPTPDPEPATTAAAPAADDSTAAAPATTEDGSAAAKPNATRPPSARNKSNGGSAPAPPSKKTSEPKKPRSSVAGSGTKKAAGSSASAADHSTKTYKPGDIVLARLKGYPPWPARVIDPEDAPKEVIRQRPGKNPSVYCVQYFPAADHSWTNAKEITPLSSADIKKFLSEKHRKPGPLQDAYKTADDPTEWEAGLADRKARLEAEQAEVDELQDDDEEEDEESGSKRKKASSKAPKKKAKTTKGTDDGESKSKTKAAAKSKTDSKPAAKQPDSKAEPGDDDPMANDPECIKVKDWRHKLQRAFLGKGLPTAEEMDTYDKLFTTIEEYKDMSIEALTYSKIGKVMKKIATLENIPKNGDLKITDRASKLMHTWQEFIESKNGGQANGDAKDE